MIRSFIYNLKTNHNLNLLNYLLKFLGFILLHKITKFKIWNFCLNKSILVVIGGWVRPPSWNGVLLGHCRGCCGCGWWSSCSDCYECHGGCSDCHEWSSWPVPYALNLLSACFVRSAAAATSSDCSPLSSHSFTTPSALFSHSVLILSFNYHSTPL